MERDLSLDLIINEIYKRSDIHDAFGGNRQGGISPSSDGRHIFIFSNHSGESHGYQDGWDGGYYAYTGAGQSGNQDIESRRHNGHILHHSENDAKVHLMIGVSSGHWRYEADLTLVDFEHFETHDKDGRNRQAVRFFFEKTGNQFAQPNPSRPAPPPYRKPDVTSRKGLITTRVGQGYYRQAIVQKFDGVCAVLRVGPTEILIASHIVPWRDSTDHERLDVENGILLSPLYDALFDKHLISFDGSGCIVFGQEISANTRSLLGLTGCETIQVSDGMQPYLERHRRELR